MSEGYEAITRRLAEHFNLDPPRRTTDVIETSATTDAEALDEMRTALLDALDDLWANIGTPEANQLQPETVKLCQFVHEVRYHGADWTDWRHWRLPGYTEEQLRSVKERAAVRRHELGLDRE